MKQGFEGRLRKLEQAYAAELDSQRAISLRWMTADELRRGGQHGLVELMVDDIDASDKGQS
jgi:hypothetical protein